MKSKSMTIPKWKAECNKMNMTRNFMGAYLICIYFSIDLLVFLMCFLKAIFCIQLRVSSLVYIPEYKAFIKITSVRP